ncbi:Nse1 non-SMC component of SMC5-6 complex-domain-containing protein [Vararia minispora EC-137]|uniref:Nse1 non-SMC component of SMC5-6 complex-domain-containing protein n=1 Tax=Vararia minispora EC-137 TaxID=1314806 RepID=A0ACB8Q8H6_9AGAM|nr:Nse1 non-SMC component of SMC5-6 complex-domain-containing protein [Vararia minispora EC-137]
MVSSNDASRLFLQAVISRRYFSTKLAQTLWRKCVEAVEAVDEALDVQRKPWDEFVAQINDSLNSLDLEFSRLHDEETGKEMWALVNRRDDDVAQVASDYSPQEIAYFKALVDEIMTAPNNAFSVSSIAAMRDPPKPGNMTKTAAEGVLSSFVARGWLLRSRRVSVMQFPGAEEAAYPTCRKGRYSLSTRGLLELQQYLKSTYPDDILECTICLEILTRGIGCFTTNCKVLMHPHCFNKYKGQSHRDTKCPSCSEDWYKDANAKRLVSIGEAAALPDELARQRRRRTPAELSGEEPEFEEDKEEDEEGAGDEDLTPIQGNGARRKSTRQAASRTASTPSQHGEMTVDDDEQDEQPRRRGGRRRA